MIDCWLDAIVSILCCGGLIYALLYGVYIDHIQHRKDIEELRE